MRKKASNFIIPLEVYPFDVMVSIGQTDAELKKSLERKSVEWEDKMCLKGNGLFYMNSQNQSIIRVRFIPVNPVDYGVLQHEIFHAVTFILDRIGMKFMLLKSDEAYAYLVGYLTEQIYTRL